jgi:hypothetical protein
MLLIGASHLIVRTTMPLNLRKKNSGPIDLQFRQWEPSRFWVGIIFIPGAWSNFCEASKLSPVQCPSISHIGSAITKPSSSEPSESSGLDAIW